jgi:hypothetical protein
MSEPLYGKDSIRYILSLWNTEREQLAALFYCIENDLAPKNPDDEVTFIAWRLSQVGSDLLSCSAEIDELCKMFGIDDLQEAPDV